MYLVIVLEQLDRRLPGQVTDMSKRPLIPFAERHSQQALPKLRKLFIRCVLTDQIPFHQLSNNEHPLVHG